MSSAEYDEPRSRGYLTLAHGPRRYVEMAVDLALSLREFDEKPVALIADGPARAVVEREYTGVFDHVIPLPDGYAFGRAPKFCLAEATPFDRTVFVDADTLAVASVRTLWPTTATSPFATIGEHLGPDEDRNHHGFSTRRLAAEFGLDHYFKNHAAVICFDREAGREILRESLEVYRELFTWRRRLTGFVGCELALGVVGARRGFGRIPEHLTVHWSDEFARTRLDRPLKPWLHVIQRVPEPLMTALMEQARRRRRAARVPGDPDSHWRNKARRSGRGVDWGKALLRIARELSGARRPIP